MIFVETEERKKKEYRVFHGSGLASVVQTRIKKWREEGNIQWKCTEIKVHEGKNSCDCL